MTVCNVIPSQPCLQSKETGFTYYEILSLIETNLQPPVDRHKEKASELFNVPYESITEEQRKVGKLVNFQLDYSCSTKLTNLTK